MKVIKSCKITLPRNEGILAIKKDCNMTLLEARDLYDNFNKLIGLNYDDIGCDVKNANWNNIICEEIEPKEQEKYKKAKLWFESLSPKNKEYVNILLELE